MNFLQSWTVVAGYGESFATVAMQGNASLPLSSQSELISHSFAVKAIRVIHLRVKLKLCLKKLCKDLIINRPIDPPFEFAATKSLTR